MKLSGAEVRRRLRTGEVVLLWISSKDYEKGKPTKVFLENVKSSVCCTDEVTSHKQ